VRRLADWLYAPLGLLLVAVFFVKKAIPWFIYLD